MQVNRILVDILDWVRRLAWWKARQVKSKPYKIIRIENTVYGLLKQIERDTPRTLSTYIFTPKAPPKYAKDKHFEYHICLDHLWALDAVTNENKVSKPEDYDKTVSQGFRYNRSHSHCITILKSSRWISKAGQYETKVLFQGYFDFIGYSPYFNNRDRWAYPIFKELIAAIRTKNIALLDFDSIIENARYKFLGKGAGRIQSKVYNYTP